MLGTIGKLFGRSPFAPLQAHMERVGACVHALTPLWDHLESGDQKGVEKKAHEISKLEHAADLSKNDIRNHLPKSLFLPVDRGNLLDVLSLQDKIADQAEDIAILLTLKPMVIPEELKAQVREFLTKNIETFDLAHNIVNELPELLESSFGGNEAEKVRIMVDHVAKNEHQVDLLQRELVKEIVARDEILSTASFYLWMRLIEQTGDISNCAEKLAHRIRMTLELK